MPRREEGLVVAARASGDDQQRQLGSRPELGEAATGPPQGEQVGKGVKLGHDEQQEVVEEVEEARAPARERGREQVRRELRRKKRRRRGRRGRRGPERWRRRGLDLCPVFWCLHLRPKLSFVRGPQFDIKVLQRLIIESSR